MRQIKTKNIQIPLKSDSFKPFLKLILFNDKMGYLNRWLANCKINQNMVRSTRGSYQKNRFLCILPSIISVPYDPTQIPPVHDPRQISVLQLFFLQAGVAFVQHQSSPGPQKSGIRKLCCLISRKYLMQFPGCLFSTISVVSRSFFTALISILSGKQLHV